MLLVVTALRQGRNHGYTVERLQDLFGVTRPTLTRWLTYFRKLFPCSRAWLRLSGRLMPPVAEYELPGGLIDRFVQTRGDPERGLTVCLQAILLGP